MNSKSPVNRFVWSIFWENSKKITFLGCPRKIYCRFMYIAPSIGEPLIALLRRFEVVLWCLEWECCTLFKILMKINSNPPILYYGFKIGYCRLCLDDLNEFQSDFHNPTGKVICSTYSHAQLVSLGPTLL